jgi:hypothetical protein
MNATAHLAQFKHYAGIYHQFDHFEKQSREAIFFDRLAAMDTTIVYPLLLEVFHRHQGFGGREAIVQILVDLESYLMRRMICGMTNKNYNRIFRDLVRQMTDTNDFSPAAIRNFLLRQDAETARWPNDTDFYRAWISQPIYSLFTQRRTRMILEALDRHIHQKFAEQYTVHGKLTIEHLLPQSWEQHWPLPADIDPEEAAERRNRLRHTIGNLTLLTKALNPSLSNDPWEKKRERIAEHSILNLNQGLPPHWDEAAIEQRSAALFAAAREIWPYPASS